jgi:hypothetical protein
LRSQGASKPSKKLDKTLREREQALAQLVDHQCAVEELQLAQAELRQNQDRGGVPSTVRPRT